ncbi:MAG: hypothetical protein EB120_07460, partial [Proteobacteria bacterium]|nr:hypothetical protein [Pseudomonadota bacterium]
MKLKQPHKWIVISASFFLMSQPALSVDRRGGQFSRNFSTFPQAFNFQANQFGTFPGNFSNGNGLVSFNGFIPDLNAQVNQGNLLRFGRGNRFEFFQDAQEVAGFSRLLQRGNQLIGQTSAGDHIQLFIDRNGNLVDRTGRRVSNRDPSIVKEAREFFLLNRNKFQGNQAFQVDRFLSASGAFGNGTLTIDLASFSLPEKKEGDKIGSDLPNGANRIQAGLAALNFFLNSIQNRCLIRIFDNQVNFGAGTVSLDLSGFRDANGNLCFNGQTLGLMANADQNAQCNGGKQRINELINTMMDPSRYNAAQGIAGLNR